MAKLEELLAKKEKIIGKLNSVSELEREALEQVQTKLSRNQHLWTARWTGSDPLLPGWPNCAVSAKGWTYMISPDAGTRYGTRSGAKLEKRA